MAVRILVGDALSRLAQLPDASVHCAITSPPYWGQRGYTGEPGMIGMEPTFAEHLDSLLALFREVRRVLRPDGTLWVNYGDAYMADRGGTHMPAETLGGGTAGTMPDGSRTNRNRPDARVPRRDARSHGHKHKELMLMTARLALALQAEGAADAAALGVIDRARAAILDAHIGSETIPDRALDALDRLEDEYREAKGEAWWLRSEIVWHKSSASPESVTDRPTQAHEKMFLLAKSGGPLFWTHAGGLQPVRSRPEPDYYWRHKQTAEERDDCPPGWIKNTPDFPWTRLNRWQGHDYFYDHAAVATEAKEASPGSTPHRGLTVKGRGSGTANLRNVWKLPTASYKGAHFATFPPALVEPCIKAGTSAHGVCDACGAPWHRQVERIPGKVRSYPDTSERTALSERRDAPSGRTPGLGEGADKVTVGWQPTCDCEGAAIVPATVLDPFAGSGTVGLVANQLGRSAVLVEISQRYARMAEGRIVNDAPLFSRVSVEL